MLKQKSNQAGGSSTAAIQGPPEKRDDRRDKNETPHATSELLNKN